MEAKLGGFSGGSNNEPDKGEGCVKFFGGGKHLLYFSGVQVCCYSCYCKDESNITDSVVNYCLYGRGVGIRAPVPSADEKKGHNAHALSPNKKLIHIICCD